MQVFTEFLKFPLGWKWIKLDKCTNLHRLTDMAGGGIRGYQLLLRHLSRQPSSEVLRVASLSSQLLSHLSSQEQLNSSRILLSRFKGKYILLNVWSCRPRMFHHFCKFGNFAVWSHFPPYQPGQCDLLPWKKITIMLAVHSSNSSNIWHSSSMFLTWHLEETPSDSCVLQSKP